MAETWVLATGNAGKLREFNHRLRSLEVNLKPQSDYGVPEAEETGQSFLENALIKARNAATHAGMPALADDSGLRVEALDGRPGVHSARFAGPTAGATENNALLLDRLAGSDQRRAAFHCVLVWMRSADDPAPVVAQAAWHGRILTTPRGEGGFGYDPLFEVPDLGLSAAELDPDHKNRISHRGQAIDHLLTELARLR